MEYVLAIALITWGGVFFYILRLEKLARGIEKQVETLKTQTSDAPQTTSARQHLNV